MTALDVAVTHRRPVTALLDLVLPADCAGCGARSVVVCADCLALLRAMPSPAWPRPSPRGLPAPFAVAAYDGPVRAMLLAVKEDGIAGLQRPLGRALAHAVAAALPLTASLPLRLVPVPSSAAARRQRGEDVVRRLTAVAAGELRRSGVPATVVPALRHARAVADSAGLGAQARAANLAGAFAARPRLAGRLRAGSVVLVDDLITTGVTLAGCATALADADIRVLGCATVAATQRHSP